MILHERQQRRLLVGHGSTAATDASNAESTKEAPSPDRDSDSDNADAVAASSATASAASPKSALRPGVGQVIDISV